MTGIQRFTTDYVPVEDRIRLSLERDDGSVRVLWLTRPLLDKLGAGLVKRLNEAAPSDRSIDKLLKSGAQQRFTQQAAEASIKPQKPVRAQPSDKQAVVAMLVTSITLRNDPKALITEFKGGDQVLETVPFSAEALRQWLSVLHRCYCHAGWGGDFWPSWITSPAHENNAARLN